MTHPRLGASQIVDLIKSRNSQVFSRIKSTVIYALLLLHKLIQAIDQKLHFAFVHLRLFVADIVASENSAIATIRDDILDLLPTIVEHFGNLCVNGTQIVGVFGEDTLFLR